MATHAAVSESSVQFNEAADVVALGNRAVEQEELAALSLSDRQRWLAQGSDGLAAAAERQSDAHLREAMAELADTRARLGSLSETDKHELESYLALHLGPPGRRHMGHATYVDWLADPVRGATDDELFGFLRSHVGLIARQQKSQEVQAAERDTKQQIIERQAQAVANRHFSRFALERAQVLEGLRVYVGDVWDTILKGFNGYHIPSSDEAVVAQGYRGSSLEEMDRETADRVRRVLPHESDHRQFGWWEARWFREAMAEHNTLSLADGRFNVLDPHMRGNEDSNIYVEERELVALLAHEGSQKISSDIVTRAHTSRGPTSDEWQAWLEALDSAWGIKDMYQKVSNHIHVLEGVLESRGLPRHQRQIAAVREVSRSLREYQSTRHKDIGVASVEQNPAARSKTARYTGRAAVKHS